MDGNDEHTDLARSPGVLNLAEEVGVGRRREEVVRGRRGVGHSTLLVEVGLVSVDVELVDAVPRVHVVAETPLGASDDEEEGYETAERSQVPHDGPHVDHFVHRRCICRV